MANKEVPRKPENWDALKAWAWGAARALDLLEKDENVDSKKL